jgi:hypothetical protein
VTGPRRGEPPRTRRLTNAEAGVGGTRPGAERLLAALVKRGLDPAAIAVAAALALELDGGDGRR